MVFGHFTGVTKIPFVLSDWAGSFPVPAMVFMRIFPLLGTVIVGTAILMIFPKIATFLPSFMAYQTKRKGVK